ncbi:N-acetyltransferase GCN5 [Enterobacter cloacae]|uniref:N-acetyltransferase GCN5 n=1 Tax=Enterobacter cloacae TaxID=550 RepID=A0A377LVE8_ENTCL|nr:N-acetyltransferase GCN5 [Enterobacter cloacae]
MIQWQDLHHSELTVQTLYALLKLRCEVFVVNKPARIRTSMVMIWWREPSYSRLEG